MIILDSFGCQRPVNEERLQMLGRVFCFGAIIGLFILSGQATATAQQPPALISVTDPATGMRIGIPDKVLVKRSINTSGGARWQDKDEKITLDLIPFKPGDDLAAIFAKGTATTVAGRTITRKDLKPDHFIIIGETAGGKFIRRMEKRADGAIGGFSLGYDKALAKTFDTLAGQIAASYAARPAPVQTAAPPAASPVAPPDPTRRSWFVATLIAEDTLITASAAIANCKVIKAVKNTATVLKRDEASGLALLKLPADGTPVVLAGTASDHGFVAMRDEDGRLELAPARYSAGRVEAAIQRYGAGAALLDNAGRLVGIMPGLPQMKFRVAGAIPEMRYPVASAEAIARFAGLPTPETKTSATASLGAISDRTRTAIFELTCEM